MSNWGTSDTEQLLSSGGSDIDDKSTSNKNRTFDSEDDDNVCILSNSNNLDLTYQDEDEGEDGDEAVSEDLDDTLQEEMRDMMMEEYSLADSSHHTTPLHIKCRPHSQQQQHFIHRPIVVGYAFGPKKMSTMGVVMAEASKAKLSCTSNVPEDSFASSKDVRDPAFQGLTRDTLSTYQAQQESRHHPYLPPLDRIVFTMDGLITNTAPGASNGSGTGGVQLHQIVRHFRSACSSMADDSESTGTCTASIASQVTATSATPYYPTSSSVGNIFTNNCTAASNNNPQHSTKSSLTRQTASITTTESSISTSTQPSRIYQHPIRVSFVPLDLEFPLQEQHGASIDVVLHKLTEDILCISQLAHRRQNDPYLQQPLMSSFLTSTALEQYLLNQGKQDNSGISNEEAAAMRRVYRLCQFQKDHPSCCLVDPPDRVQTVMSRSDIAQTLHQSLHGVVSTGSGIMVSCPRSCVLSTGSSSVSLVDAVMKTVQDADLAFPVILKPLIAAGTKASHAMAVVLDPPSLVKLMATITQRSQVTEEATMEGPWSRTNNSTTAASLSLPCLCQEYANHDSTLYKVYVLGDFVSVHKRRSLPNLPRYNNTIPHEGSENELLSIAASGFVEFDSQRSYPRLSDFGLVSWSSKNQWTERPHPFEQNHPPWLNVSVEEVLPIVTVLKAAFGLHLFGFDVLVTANHTTSSPNNKPNADNTTSHIQQRQHASNPECYSSIHRGEENSNDMERHDHDDPLQDQQQLNYQMLVVDVNYFPSYKEVPHFPALLAKYLTDQAMEQRQKDSPNFQSVNNNEDKIG